ncbi:SEC-C domain-containing protein [Corynebacterium sp. TAE3-ERU12]|nr:SEC-C domain-containing protein [Corynebacterium sp. TAE3-ERU12]
MNQSPWGRSGAAGQRLLTDADPCPCDTNKKYGQCCGPFHREEQRPPTPLDLMRARYSAYVAHEADFIWRTWHPQRRPELVTFDPHVRWQGLEILDVVGGHDGEREGIVEFRAHYTDQVGPAMLWERSTFMMRGKRWMYVDGEFLPHPPAA